MDEDDDLTPEQTELLADLGRVLGPDPLPRGLIERAEQLLAYRSLGAELAALRDEAAAEPAGLRGGAPATRLRFDLADGAVAVELDTHRNRLSGQVLTGDVTEVALERPNGGSEESTVDGLGRFAFRAVPPGPARLRLRGPGLSVTTEWFLA